MPVAEACGDTQIRLVSINLRADDFGQAEVEEFDAARLGGCAASDRLSARRESCDDVQDVVFDNEVVDGDGAIDARVTGLADEPMSPPLGSYLLMTQVRSNVSCMADTRAIRWSAWTLFFIGAQQMLLHIRTMTLLGAPPDERTDAIYKAMNAYTVADFPIPRSILSRYFGYSLLMAAMCLLVAALVLVTVKSMQNDREGLRRLARIYTGGLLVLTVISMSYFIWPHTVFFLVSFGLAAFALAGFRKAA